MTVENDFTISDSPDFGGQNLEIANTKKVWEVEHFYFSEKGTQSYTSFMSSGFCITTPTVLHNRNTEVHNSRVTTQRRFSNDIKGGKSAQYAFYPHNSLNKGVIA